MQRIFLTGSSGFVGTSFLNYFKNEMIRTSSRGEESNIDDAKIVIHLAGKAHDLKNASSPEEYYEVNTELTKRVFDSFLVSDANVFITLSSVKAVADEVNGVLSEDDIANPITHYGKSKLLADEYILAKDIPEGKRVYILRPCMIHGAGNKGNLNLLYKIVSKGIPWPLGAFENKRSYCSIENLMFIFEEFMQREDIPSGVYNVSDNDPVSTNYLISIIAESLDIESKIWRVSKAIIKFFAKIGDFTKLPLNSERLEKLTQNYVVSNQKIKIAIGKDFPVNAIDGLKKTIRSFN